MREKEIIIPVRFFFRLGKTRMRLGGRYDADISVKTKWPLFTAYFYLAFKILAMGIRRGLAL